MNKKWEVLHSWLNCFYGRGGCSDQRRHDHYGQRFSSAGGPNEVLHAIAEAGVKDLTVICNDGGDPKRDHSLAELIHNGQVAHLWATHIGLNPEVGQKMNDGSMKVTLVPQGSMAEKIRAGGYGLGGVLTPTGLATPVGEGAGRRWRH